MPKEYELEKFESPDDQPPYDQIPNIKNLKIEHKFIEQEGKRHVFTLFFDKELGIHDTIKVFGRCQWKGYLKLEDSDYWHKVITPLKRLVLNIFFPTGVKKEDIEAWVVIRSMEKPQDICHMEIPHPICHSESKNKSYIQVAFNELMTKHAYGVKWKLKRVPN